VLYVVFFFYFKETPVRSYQFCRAATRLPAEEITNSEVCPSAILFGVKRFSYISDLDGVLRPGKIANLLFSILTSILEYNRKSLAESAFRVS